MFNSYEYHNNLYYNIPINYKILIFFLLDILILSLFIPYNLFISAIIIISLIILSKTKLCNYITLINKLKFLLIVILLINLNNFSLAIIPVCTVILLSLNIKLLTTTTRTDELFDKFNKLLLFFNIKNKNIIRIINYTIYFIPLISDGMLKILRSQEARGIDFKQKKIRYKLKSLNSILLPLFMSTIKRCQQLVISLDLRSFNDDMC